MKEWEAETRIRDGQVNVEFADGSRIVVKNDGVTGYGFVTEYLQRMKVHYSAHLLAVDQILQRDLADDYKSVKAVPNLYNSHLAVQSMNCVFGKCDEILDYDKDGEFHMEFTHCPRRATCRFNGYNEKYRGKLVVGCNPVYECGLTPSQARLAQLMVESDMQEVEMAEALNVSLSTVKNTRKAVFATLGVGCRAELSKKLRGKRLL